MVNSGKHWKYGTGKRPIVSQTRERNYASIPHPLRIIGKKALEPTADWCLVISYSRKEALYTSFNGGWREGIEKLQEVCAESLADMGKRIMPFIPIPSYSLGMVVEEVLKPEEIDYSLTFTCHSTFYLSYSYGTHRLVISCWAVRISFCRPASNVEFDYNHS